MSELVLAIVRNRRFGDATLKFLLERLAWEAREDGSQIAVSVDALAEDLDLTDKTIRRAIRKAEKLGLLRLVDRERGRWPRLYSLDVPYLRACPLTNVGGRREEQRGAMP